ncbi:MAG TPA: hypothetical protein VNW99_05515 [Cytophagaceae bacterium]|jgi:hypothetical protein|nr:hypothetical protein [Cytophagaceae bacterium]
MKTANSFKVFIQEDDLVMQKKIARELKPLNYRISFFSKSESTFDLLNFNPDILIQDYAKNKVVNYYEWLK